MKSAIRFVLIATVILSCSTHQVVTYDVEDTERFELNGWKVDARIEMKEDEDEKKWWGKVRFDFEPLEHRDAYRTTIVIDSLILETPGNRVVLAITQPEPGEWEEIQMGRPVAQKGRSEKFEMSDTTTVRFWLTSIDRPTGQRLNEVTRELKLKKGKSTQVSVEMAQDTLVQRQGMTWGLGIGISANTYARSFGTGNTSTSAFVTNYRLGYATSEQLEIYYSGRTSWFQEYSALVLLGLSSLSVSYYLQPEAPTFYLTGGLGLAHWSPIVVEGSGGPSSGGVGFVVGGGYEFARHWTFDVGLIYSALNDVNNAFSVSFTLNWLSY